MRGGPRCRFEGRSAVRTWLFSIATNVCLDMLKSRRRRARPMDTGPAKTPDAVLTPPLEQLVWIAPVPDSRVLSSSGDPADVAVARDTIRLAFVCALQTLPPRQRAVLLLLREVLQWSAAEVAGLLGSTVASVNSALQRAHATLEAASPESTDPFEPLDERQRSLLARYVDAFERYDMAALVTLLHEDARLSMPPYDMWLCGVEHFTAWLTGRGHECQGSKFVPVVANGSPAFGQYRAVRSAGCVTGYQPWALQVVELAGGCIVAVDAFLDTEALFPLFGLPSSLPTQPEL